jgi:hypothetical protein
MNESVKEGMEKNPQTTHKMGLYIYMRNQEPHGLPPRSSCNHLSPLKQLWVNKNIIK